MRDCLDRVGLSSGLWGIVLIMLIDVGRPNLRVNHTIASVWVLNGVVVKAVD